MGIVIGAIAGVALLALGAFFLGRRRRRHEPAPIPPEGPYSYKDAYSGNTQAYQLSATEGPHMLDAQDPRPGARPVWELSG